MKTEIILSKLGHTWILDFDGTIVKHNGYLIDGEDTILPQTKEFIDSLPSKDMVIFLTSRKEEYRPITEIFLNKHKIRYDHIIFDAPLGERILINDMKPSGLKTAYSINLTRDRWNGLCVVEDENM